MLCAIAANSGGLQAGEQWDARTPPPHPDSGVPLEAHCSREVPFPCLLTLTHLQPERDLSSSVPKGRASLCPLSQANMDHENSLVRKGIRGMRKLGPAGED